MINDEHDSSDNSPINRHLKLSGSPSSTKISIPSQLNEASKQLIKKLLASGTKESMMDGIRIAIILLRSLTEQERIPVELFFLIVDVFKKSRQFFPVDDLLLKFYNRSAINNVKLRSILISLIAEYYLERKEYENAQLEISSKWGSWKLETDINSSAVLLITKFAFSYDKVFKDFEKKTDYPLNSFIPSDMKFNIVALLERFFVLRKKPPPQLLEILFFFNSNKVSDSLATLEDFIILFPMELIYLEFKVLLLQRKLRSSTESSEILGGLSDVEELISTSSTCLKISCYDERIFRIILAGFSWFNFEVRLRQTFDFVRGNNFSALGWRCLLKNLFCGHRLNEDSSPEHIERIASTIYMTLEPTKSDWIRRHFTPHYYCLSTIPEVVQPLTIFIAIFFISSLEEYRSFVNYTSTSCNVNLIPSYLGNKLRPSECSERAEVVQFMECFSLLFRRIYNLSFQSIFDLRVILPHLQCILV